jgi:hypothetical protein
MNDPLDDQTMWALMNAAIHGDELAKAKIAEEGGDAGFVEAAVQMGQAAYEILDACNAMNGGALGLAEHWIGSDNAGSAVFLVAAELIREGPNGRLLRGIMAAHNSTEGTA